MKYSPFVKALCFLCVLCGSALPCVALDREAFSIPHYDLHLQIDPEQHRLGVRGQITLRNDTSDPQKIAILQISSSLAWRFIKAGDVAVQFVTQPYASDIDHTGGLSEAILTFPDAVAPHKTVDLKIAYEGVILLDATRLTRIGTPLQNAENTDWDQIATNFTGLRGAGHVAWYPIATAFANLSEDNSLFEVLMRWNAREAGATMQFTVESTALPADSAPPTILCNGKKTSGTNRDGSSTSPQVQCSEADLARSVPTLVIAHYGLIDRPGVTIYNLASHALAAERYAEVTAQVAPLIRDWFGAPREKAQTADLPNPEDDSFESGALLLTPMTDAGSNSSGLAAAHQLTHATFFSSRPWVQEGLAHFSQALYLEQGRGRKAAIDYMQMHRSALGKLEQSTAFGSGDESRRSLVNTTDEELYRSKAMCVWWMLRDMVGDSVLKKGIAAYRPEQDKEPSYMPRLIAGQTPRDLEWFFDDWIYRDRGLPDFKVESAYSRKTISNAFLLTITVDNLGSAGAEVPIVVKFAGGEVSKRLEVRGKGKGTIRIDTPGSPQEITVNDGSVPESDTGNNQFKIEGSDQSHSLGN
jgi:hypothetical protein